MPKTCFVCMPLIPDLDPIFQAVREVVAATLGASWKCVKADDQRSPGMITQKISISLLNSDLVIALISDTRSGRRGAASASDEPEGSAHSVNPNVMYELGIAHSFRKPAIVMSEIGLELPFDIKSVETILFDRSKPDFVAALKKDLERAIEGADRFDNRDRRQIPSNPVTAHLTGRQIFIEDLPWVWGYCDVLKRERTANAVWEITQDLYWAGEDLFFASIRESIERKKKHYFMIEDEDVVRQKVEKIKRGLQQSGVSKNAISDFIHFVPIESHYFKLWPISVVLYDADTVKRQGGIICEPMMSQVGNDSFDQIIRRLWEKHGKGGEFTAFEEKVEEITWTERRLEATFDISLDVRVVEKLATSFTAIWNEKILEEAQGKSGDEKASLLTHWLIGG